MSESNTGKKLGDHAKTILKKWWLILGLLVMTTGAAVYLYTREPVRYRTSMKVELARTSESLKDNSPASEFLQGFLDTKTQFKTEFNLLQDPYVKKLMIEQQIKGRQPVPEHFRNRTTDDILEELESSISLREIRQTNLVEIVVTGEKPELLPTIAKLLWQQFNDILEDRKKSQMDVGLAGARKERDKAQRDYEESDEAVQEHLRRASISETRFLTLKEELPGKESSLSDRLDVHDEFLTLKGDVYQGVKLAQAGEGTSGLVSFYEDEVVTSNASVQELKNAIISLRRAFEDYREQTGIGPGHQKWKQFEANLAEMELRLESLQQRILADFVRDYEAQKKRYEQLGAQMSTLKEDIDQFQRVAKEYEQLDRDRKKKQKRLDELNDAWADIWATMGRDALNTSGLSLPPSEPRQYYPKLFVFLIGGILLGLFLGIGLTFTLAAIDDTFRQEDEIETALKLPCLGVIHRPDSRRGGTPAVDLASVVDPRSIFAEEFRSIRTSLGFTFDRRRGRHYSMCVSSFDVQEGKTTVSTNLATVIAASGLRTLLIDADMRNGRIHRTFGLTNEAGLSDVLAKESELDQAIEDTEIPNLSILPSGSLYDNPAEMLEGPRMRELLEELSERYDRVVFDTPPSGAVTDSKILGKQVDAVVLVAATGKSRKRLLRKTVKEMTALGVRVAGVVLNEMKPGRKRYYRKYLHLYRRNTA